MTSAACRLLASGICLLILTPLALAHQDDPKEKDRVPPYRGPAYQLPPRAPSPLATSRRGGLPDTQESTAGMQGDFAASGITLRGWISLPEFAPQIASGNDCWGYVSPSGREYALMGLSHGTGFVEVTDPGEPVQLALIAGANSLWRDIKVYEDHAYAVSEGGSGIQVVDMSQIDSGIVTLVNTITTGGATPTHNVAIDEVSGYLYRCGGDGNGLRIYALKPTAQAPGATKSNPVFVGAWPDRYVHDAEIVTYTFGPYAGRTIAFCCSGFNNGWVETGLDVLDVTDPANIIDLDREFYPQAAYSHQCWLSEDRQYLYLDDEVAGSDFNLNSRTIIINVADPGNVSYVAQSFNSSPAVTHNVYVKDNLLFAANYRSGLRVFSLDNPTAPVEVAYFDTWPTDDGKSYNGLWSSYPYFPSGTIIGSDLERGLFIWSLGDPDLEFTYPQGFPETLSSPGSAIPVNITTAAGAQLVAGTASLHYNAGSGWQTVPMTELGGEQFVMQFPELPCGADVQFYLSAQSPEGNTWRDPVAQSGGIYQLTVGDDFTFIHHDACEANFGWQVGTAGDNATTGIWELATPNGTSAAPSSDASPPPGTKCWITGQDPVGGSVGDNDIDNGTTTLTSPSMNALGDGVAFVRYARWYSNNQGSTPNTDSMPVYISNNNGATWMLLETVTENAGAWVETNFRVSDFVTPSANMRLRFVASDLGEGSIVEAGVDEVKIVLVECDPPVICPGDLVSGGTFTPPADGTVDGADLAFMLGEWGNNPGSPADIVSNTTFQPPPDGFVDGADLAFLLGAWGACK
jgi:choice-of-anchor B domain-containing protein